MKKLFYIVVFMGMGLCAHSQFTIIPTGTSSDITDIASHNDTIIVSGKTNFFAKSFDGGQTLIPYSPAGIINYYNSDFQIIQNTYYIMSLQGFPYDHNYILKSTDYGNSWNILYDTIGLFHSLTMLDTTFGIMGGAYGSYAMTQGSDNFWALDTLYSVLTASKGYGDSTLLLLSFGGMSYLTNNRGNSFTWGYCHSSEHEEIQFISKDTVYSVSHKGAGNPKSYFSYSFNGGLNFSTVDIGYNTSTSQYDFYSRIYDLYFDTPQHGYAIGYIYKRVVGFSSINVNEATIFETNDYGSTWTPYLTGFSEEFYDLLNVNDSIAFIGGQNGLLLKWNKNIPLTNILSVNELSFSENLFSIFPNPANNNVVISLSVNNFSDTKVLIINVHGEIIYQSIFETNSIALPTSTFANGVYFVHVLNKNQNEIKKLVIQH